MDLYTLLAAIATSTSIHRMMEPMNIIQKLERLDDALKTGKISDPKMKGIDTRTKSYGLGIGLLVIMTVVAYGVVSLFGSSNDSLVQYAIGITLLGELVSLVSIDKYHVAIESVTKRAGKK